MAWDNGIAWSLYPKTKMFWFQHLILCVAQKILDSLAII